MPKKRAYSRKESILTAHQHDPHRDQYGNPKDLEAYLARLEGPARMRWQKPNAVVKALALKPGETVAEIGAGSGYFTFRLAKAVGPRGRVFAADVEPTLLTILRDRIEEKKITNITPILASQHDPHLPLGIASRVLIVNTFHHIPNGAVYLRVLKGCLAPRGQIVNVDFREGDFPVGPPEDHKMRRADFVSIVRASGLHISREHTFLPYQYVLVLEP